MEYRLIDYSSDHFRDGLGEDVPPERGGKFIQVRGKGVECIVLAPREFAYYHANVVEKFLLGQGVTGTFTPKGDYFIFHDADWTIVGGGMWNMNEETRELNLYGTSQAYGAFDSAGLRESLLGLPLLTGWRVRVTSA
jgi:hypothetical protein